jgi:hypothetical protein
MMKLNLLSLITALMLFAGNTWATEYIFRDLMANTLPSAKCESEQAATATAAKAYTLKRYGRKFCQTKDEAALAGVDLAWCGHPRAWGKAITCLWRSNPARTQASVKFTAFCKD